MSALSRRRVIAGAAATVAAAALPAAAVAGVVQETPAPLIAGFPYRYFKDPDALAAARMALFRAGCLFLGFLRATRKVALSLVTDGPGWRVDWTEVAEVA
jgi:hypothetical protein